MVFDYTISGKRCFRQADAIDVFVAAAAAAAAADAAVFTDGSCCRRHPAPAVN